MENPIKMDDLGVPLFLETPIKGMKSEPVLSGLFRTIASIPVKLEGPVFSWLMSVSMLYLLSENNFSRLKK